MMCVLGVPGWRLLESRDPVERVALVALTTKAIEARSKLDDALARRIVGGL